MPFLSSSNFTFYFTQRRTRGGCEWVSDKKLGNQTFNLLIPPHQFSYPDHCFSVHAPNVIHFLELKHQVKSYKCTKMMKSPFSH